ncbi:MAG: hypothetical protein QOE96_3823 [Blastocatellia bacterium]|nr:hypothetical protein [Blastocatellia bacterium]
MSMRLTACPQVLALIVLISCVLISGGDQICLAQVRPVPVALARGARQQHRPIRQSPQSVNVRPRVAASQPGVPAVKVTADRDRVPLGELVTFTLTPANVVTNSSYKVTLYFGDGEHQVMRQTRIAHLYSLPRNYTYSLLVEPSGTPPRPPVPAVPGVRLVATPTSVEINRQVGFAAQLSHSYPNLKYRFVLGDGSSTEWQDSPQATHSFRSPGSFQAYVDLGLGNRGVIKQIGGSPRQTINVTAPPPQNLTVDLTANKETVQTKDEVDFSARVNSGDPSVRYRFDFGDRSGPNTWQVSPRSRHVYSSSGYYSARVEVRIISRSGNQTASSNRLAIKVKPPSVAGVSLSVTPQSVPAGFPVYFRATADSANSKTRYRFSFGDGSSPSAWKKTPDATHIYSLAGDYPVFVEVGVAGNRSRGGVAASGEKRVQVLPLIPFPPATPTPSPVAKASPSPIGSESPTPDASRSVAPTPSPSPVGSGSPLNPGTTPSPKPNGSGSPLSVVLTASPSPTPSPTSEPAPQNDRGWWRSWWIYLLLLLILLGGYQGWKYFYGPRPTLVPNMDPGKSALDTKSGPLSINYQVELDPNLSGGQFVIDPTEGSLIKSERKSNG